MSTAYAKFSSKTPTTNESNNAKDIGPIKRDKVNAYKVAPGYQKKFLNHEIEQFQRAFTAFDANNSGTIQVHELQDVLKELNENCSKARAQQLIQEMDKNQNGSIEFNEFLGVLDSLRTGAAKPNSFGAFVQKKQTLNTVQGQAGAMHSYSEEERLAFTEHINNCLKNDAHLQYLLPIDVQESTALFDAVKDGVLLSKLINAATSDTLDERAINYPKEGKDLSIYQKTENQNLVINAARSIGCTVINVGSQDLIEGKPILVLGLIWQIVKIQLLSQITLKNYPELVRLLKDGEELSSLLCLSPEDILLRWINFHLAAANHPKRVHNFSNDVKDSEAYLVLLHQLAPELCSASAVHSSDLHERAAAVIANARRLEVECFIQSRDIVQGNKKLNLAFLAQLFNTRHGLEVTQEELYEMAGMLEDDEGDSREERTFRMWINSLNITDVYVNNLFLDICDGVVLLKVMDKIEPGMVHWRKVNLQPNSRFKKVENCNYCIVLGKELQFSMVNVGGLDILDGNRKLILAIIWQLMRHHALKILSSISTTDGKVIGDNEIVSWANKQVSNAGRKSKMASFRDRSLSTGEFLIDLCYSIEPRAVNWDLVTKGATEEDRRNNAKYTISIARKLGAVVFLTCDDVVEVKSKMIMTLVASLMATSHSCATEAEPEENTTTEDGEKVEQ